MLTQENLNEIAPILRSIVDYLEREVYKTDIPLYHLRGIQEGVDMMSE